MPFELNPAIFDTYDKSFPMPDIEGAMDRRKRRELADRQLQQQADIAAQNRIERAREFNARGAEWGGPDTVVDSTGVFDPVATSLARKKRQDAEMIQKAMGLESVIAPESRPATFIAGDTANMPGAPATQEVPLDVNTLTPEARMARAAALQEKAKQEFDLRKAAAQFQNRQTLQTSRMTATEANRMLREARSNDPEFSQSEYDPFRVDGTIDPEKYAELAARHGQIMSAATTRKSLPMGSRWFAMTPAQKEAAVPDPEQRAKLDTELERSPALRNAKLMGELMRKEAVDAGKKPDETAIEATVRNVFENGGKLQPIPAKQQEVMNGRIAVIDTIDGLFDDVKGFEEKFGKGSFDGYIGLLPKTAQDIKAKLAASTKPEDQEAYQILSTLARVRNGELLTRSGKAVTANEAKRLADELGDATDKNTFTKLQRVRRDDARDLARDLKISIRNGADVSDYYKDWLNSDQGGKNVEVRSDMQANAEKAKTTSGLSPEARRARIAELKAKLNQ